ncbi:MAG: deoxyribose-phosphate aldolase [Oscillospiraceae bacterium]|nr:deoxyribose-phosphate aldolase [Oscillospiraceae bacterium]MBR0451097.1 deoxyribose-phosphate aldolase [Oscillospiraceae bacterium]
MEAKEILKKVDHTLLKAISDWESIKKICEDALEYNTASVCIPPSYVKRAHEEYPELNVCTVIGFPLGYNTTAVKVFEAKDAIENGAKEIDMVINIGDVKNGDWDLVLSEVKALREATEGYILKVIIETCYLTEEEKIKMCEIVTEARADYIKTSTGFGTAGATIEDVKLFKEHVGPDVLIKAAGGMKTVEDIEAFAELGCSRLGTSSAMRLFKEAGKI